MNPDLRHRVRVWWVGHRELWHLFCARHHLPGVVTIHRLDGVPADAEVVEVFHAPERRAFGFVLSSREFDESEPGEPLRSIGPGLDSLSVAIGPAQHHEEWPLFEALKAENARLRAVFGDLLTDDAARRAIRDDALEEAAKVVEEGGGPGAALEDAIRLGPNAAIAMMIRRRKGQP